MSTVISQLFNGKTDPGVGIEITTPDQTAFDVFRQLNAAYNETGIDGVNQRIEALGVEKFVSLRTMEAC